MPYKVAVITGSSAAAADEFAGTLSELGHEPNVLTVNTSLSHELASSHVDVACVVPDGKQDRSGSVEALLELLDIPHIGSSAPVRAQAYDRSTLEHAVRAHALFNGGVGDAHVPRNLALMREHVEGMGLQACLGGVVESKLDGYPLFVRTLHQVGGFSSRHVIGSEAELRGALTCAFSTGDDVLVQELVEGVAVSVAVLGQGDDAFAFPPVETGKELHAPVRLSSLSGDEAQAQAIRSELERAAVQAHNAYGARGYSRVDLIWDGARACVVDVDLAPSLLDGSLFARSCEVAKVSMQAVLEELLDQAVLGA